MLPPSGEDDEAGPLAEAPDAEALVASLIERAEAAVDPRARARDLVRAAVVYEQQLGDAEKASLLVQAALQEDPESPDAAALLAERSWEAGRLAEALPLLETALPAIEARGAPERARWHGRIAEAAIAVGALARAREHYAAAHRLHPHDPALVATFVALAWENQWWPEVRELCEWRLAHPEAGLSGAAKADCLEQLGRACLALGDAAAAVGVLAKGLDLVPDHLGCRRAMIEASDRLGDAASAMHHQRALAALLGSDDERFEQLAAVARRWRDQGGDAQAAIKAFDEALALRPDEHALLHEQLDLLTATRQWKRAVQVLEKLTGMEEGRAKARYLVATGNILNYELHAADEAIELYNRALDEDPDDFKTFERIDKVLSAKRAWRDLARNYRRMIKRVDPNPAPDKRAPLLTLWRGLGELCRSHLDDPGAAATAFEVCASLAPDDMALQEALADVLAEQGAEGLVKGLDRRAQLLDRATSWDGIAQQLRALRRLYLQRREADRVACVCTALVVAGAADADDQETYEQFAAAPLRIPRGALTEEIWQRSIAHPRQDRRLSQVMATVAPIAALVRAKEPKGWALDERRRIGAGDRSLVPSLFAYAAGTLGIALPAIYVHPDLPGDVDLVGVVDGGRLMPSFVVGGDLTRGRSEREALFLVARAVARLRWEHLLLWPRVVPNAAELRIVLLATLKLFMPAFAPPESAEPAFRQYLALLQRALTPQTLELLMEVVPALAENLPALDLEGWAAAAAQTANRAALLVCGDLLTAARLLSHEAKARGGSADEAVMGLLRWSVSPGYLTLREQLGLGLPPDAVIAARAPGTPGLVR